VRFWQAIKRILLGTCPKCGAIGTYRRRNDTGLLLHYNYSWSECSKCGHKDDYAGKGYTY